jgi:hypothetical protein
MGMRPRRTAVDTLGEVKVKRSMKRRKATANKLPAAKAERITTVVQSGLASRGSTWYPMAKATDHKLVARASNPNALLSGALGERLNT